MYLHEKASGIISLDPTVPHLIGWVCIALGLFLAYVAVYYARNSGPDPFKDVWWRRQIQENQEDPKAPFADLFAEDLPQEHPSAPLPVVRPVSDATRKFLEEADKEWREFMDKWDAENSVIAKETEAR